MTASRLLPLPPLPSLLSRRLAADLRRWRPLSELEAEAQGAAVLPPRSRYQRLAPLRFCR